MSRVFPVVFTVGTIGLIVGLLVWKPHNGQVGQVLSEPVVAAESCAPDMAKIKERHDRTIDLLSDRQKSAIEAFDVSYRSVSTLDDREACRSIQNALLDVLDAHRKRLVEAGRLPPLRLELSREAFADATPISKLQEPVNMTRFLAMPVTSPLGEQIGQVVDIQFDPSSGRWTSFVVAKKSWLGRTAEGVTISISRLRLDEANERLIIFKRKQNREKPRKVVVPQKPVIEPSTGSSTKEPDGVAPPELPQAARDKIDKMPTRVLKVQ